MAFLSRQYLFQKSHRTAGICASIANANMLDVASQLAFHGPLLVLMWYDVSEFKRNLKMYRYVFIYYSLNAGKLSCCWCCKDTAKKG